MSHAIRQSSPTTVELANESVAAVAPNDEGRLSSIPNSEKKAASNLKARFDEEEREDKFDLGLVEKQKVFQLLLDTSMGLSSCIRPSQIKETSFESLQNVENLFLKGGDCSSIANPMTRRTQGEAETD